MQGSLCKDVNVEKVRYEKTNKINFHEKNHLLYLLLFATLFIQSSCSNSSSTLYPINKDGKYGYIDSLGNVVIEPQYLAASVFREGVAIVVTDFLKDGEFAKIKYGFISPENKLVIDTTLRYTTKDSILTFTKYIDDGINLGFPLIHCRNNRILFKDNNSGKYGFMDKKGNVIIEPQFEDAVGFYDGLASVKTGSSYDAKWGYIDINGSTVIEEKYSIEGYFSEGYALTSILDFSERDEDGGFQISFNTFIIDKKGHIVGEPINAAYIPISKFEEGVAIMKGQFMGMDFETYKYIDTEGILFPDFDLNEIKEFSNGYAPIMIETDKWVFVDKELNIVSEEYEDARIFSEGYAAVKKDKKWGGYIDTSFQVKIPFRYDECRDFHNGLATFKMKNMSLIIDGHINKSGTVVWQKETTKWE